MMGGADRPHDLGPLWDELFPAEQARGLQLLVERVDVHPHGLDIGFRVDGLESVVADIRAAGNRWRAA